MHARCLSRCWECSIVGVFSCLALRDSISSEGLRLLNLHALVRATNHSKLCLALIQWKQHSGLLASIHSLWYLHHLSLSPLNRWNHKASQYCKPCTSKSLCAWPPVNCMCECAARGRGEADRHALQAAKQADRHSRAQNYSLNRLSRVGESFHLGLVKKHCNLSLGQASQDDLNGLCAMLSNGLCESSHASHFNCCYSERVHTVILEIFVVD